MLRAAVSRTSLKRARAVSTGAAAKDVDASRKYFLLKSEPSDYSFAHLQADGWTQWDGVRSAGARKQLRSMRQGDLALFYHSSVKIPKVMGICEVCKEAYEDPVDEKWAVVDVRFVEHLEPVTLAEMRACADLEGMALLRQPRLSVQPVTPEHWDVVLRLSNANSK